MISMRFLLLLVLVGVMWRLAQSWHQRFLANQTNNQTSPPKMPQQQMGVMVRCHYCQLHLPQEEALQVGEAYFCCEAHQRAAQQNNNDVGTY